MKIGRPHLVAASTLDHVHAHCGDAPASLDYEGPVATAAEMNASAHGGHCITEVCACGHTRWVNVRDDEREEGAWQAGSEAFAAYHLRVTAARALLAEAQALVKATESAREPEGLREVARGGLVPAWTAFMGAWSCSRRLSFDECLRTLAAKTATIRQMLFGRGVDGQLIRAVPGAIATCPGCGAQLRGKCGAAKKQIWHWAHLAADCDPWHESEGEWHLAWKSRAPEGCTEVVIPPHRADIRTREGIVIELQASPIDATEIAERESFYDRMIWLLDGREWRAARRFFFARGTVRLCECAVEIRGQIYQQRRDCKVCRSGIVLELGRGDRYLWDHRRTSFDDASRPVYVDTGENVVKLHGSPKRFGGATIIAYADFCLEFGLTWDPSAGAPAAPKDDWLPDALFVATPPVKRERPQRPPTPVSQPPDGVEVRISIDGTAFQPGGTATTTESLASIAAALQADIERPTCVDHSPRALVTVPMRNGGLGWSVEHVCCRDFSKSIVSSLKAAGKRLGVLRRRQTMEARRRGA